MVKLNLGCGSVRPVGWINTVSSLNGTTNSKTSRKTFIDSSL